MIKKIALAVALVFGAMSATAMLATPAVAQAAAFTVDSTLGALLANAGAKAVLERHLGAEFVNNPQLSAASSLPLSALAQYVPTLTPEKLAQINTDLAAVQ
jgi:hypothetical protein